MKTKLLVAAAICVSFALGGLVGYGMAPKTGDMGPFIRVFHKQPALNLGKPDSIKAGKVWERALADEWHAVGKHLDPAIRTRLDRHLNDIYLGIRRMENAIANRDETQATADKAFEPFFRGEDGIWDCLDKLGY